MLRLWSTQASTFRMTLNFQETKYDIHSLIYLIAGQMGEGWEW